MSSHTHDSSHITTLLLSLLLITLAIVAAFPFAYMATVSLTQKTTLDFHFDLTTFSLANYVRVFRNFDIFINLRNSAIVTVWACILNCIIASMAAYVFAKKQFRFRELLFSIYLATMMIPGQVTLVPVFLIMKKMGLINTYPALILPFLNAFGVFLIRSFMEGVPEELLEAAKIDGSGENRMFFTIALPLIKPVLVSLVIFTFISTWNDFLWPLVATTSPEMKTLTLAVSALRGSYSTNYGLVMAGSTLTFLPPFILFMLLQKQFMEGIALSGIKG